MHTNVNGSVSGQFSTPSEPDGDNPPPHGAAGPRSQQLKQRKLIRRQFNRETSESNARLARNECQRPLSSAKIQSRVAGREAVFVVQPAKDRIGSNGIRFPATMSRRLRWDFRDMRRVWNAGP
jgi:hypothetical protein